MHSDAYRICKGMAFSYLEQLFPIWCYPKFVEWDYGTVLIGLMRNIADAIAFLHHRGLVHQDIKPDNIMFRREEEGKIVFALCDMDFLANKYSQAGADLYKPPGSENADDCYAYGMSLIALLQMDIQAKEKYLDGFEGYMERLRGEKHSLEKDDIIQAIEDLDKRSCIILHPY